MWKLRFSLRTLMLLAITTALPLAWIGRQVAKEHRYEAWIAELEARGSRIERAGESTSFWRRLLTGVRPNPVRALRVGETVPLDAVFGVRLATEFDRLEELNVQNCKLADGFIAQLPALKHLKTLSLNNTNITDSSMPDLAELTGMESLGLAKTQITDEGARHLVGLTRLKLLTMRHAPVSDACLAHLVGKKLQDLDLCETRVTPPAAQQLLDENPNMRLMLGERHSFWMNWNGQVRHVRDLGSKQAN